MKKTLLLGLLFIISLFALAGCQKNDLKVIKVCASDVPHAEILEGVVKDILKEKGYDLKVTILDWQEQNAATVNKDYDANYFQHVPYLSIDESAKGLFPVVKVHYEPLGIYQGRATNLTNGKTFEICDDISNGIRAFKLLFDKGVLNEELERNNNNYPYTDSEDNFTFTGNIWTSSDNKKVYLIPEDTLVASLKDYDFGLLPCNTALTGKISSATRVAVESDKSQVEVKANVLAARKNDYENNAQYRALIDALADALLSEEVSNYVKEKYNGVIICDKTTQIDLR